MSAAGVKITISAAKDVADSGTLDDAFDDTAVGSAPASPNRGTLQQSMCECAFVCLLSAYKT